MYNVNCQQTSNVDILRYVGTNTIIPMTRSGLAITSDYTTDDYCNLKTWNTCIYEAMIGSQGIMKLLVPVTYIGFYYDNGYITVNDYKAGTFIGTVESQAGVIVRIYMSIKADGNTYAEYFVGSKSLGSKTFGSGNTDYRIICMDCTNTYIIKSNLRLLDGSSSAEL